MSKLLTNETPNPAKERSRCVSLFQVTKVAWNTPVELLNLSILVVLARVMKD